jgi:4a-hydroxytetrahydrobiopterin dehydratase
MSRPARLDDAALAAGLRERPGWELVDGKLHRELRFGDFVEAFAFMAGVALVAERMNHHPEWSNVWATVVIDLMTHDADGVTELDLELAGHIDRLAGAASS